MTSCCAPASIRSVVSNVRLQANSIESTSALPPPLAPSLVAVDAVVCVEVLPADGAPDSDGSPVGAPGSLPLGEVLASPVDDGGSTGCGGDGGADGRRGGASPSWSPDGQSVDEVDSGAVLGRSDGAATPDGAELRGGDRRRFSPICDNDPRKSTPDVAPLSPGGTTLGILESTLLRSSSRLLLYILDASV